jgi:hypothetical protein
MKTIEYRVIYNGYAGAIEEVVRVQARSINSGFTKAVKRAREPLGNGHVREIARIEFWQVV